VASGLATKCINKFKSWRAHRLVKQSVMPIFPTDLTRHPANAQANAPTTPLTPSMAPIIAAHKINQLPAKYRLTQIEKDDFARRGVDLNVYGDVMQDLYHRKKTLKQWGRGSSIPGSKTRHAKKAIAALVKRIKCGQIDNIEMILPPEKNAKAQAKAPIQTATQQPVIRQYRLLRAAAGAAAADLAPDPMRTAKVICVK
jgi:hypothetical protein